MSLIKTLFPSGRKFTPASTEVNWTRVETLVHGPGAGESRNDANSAVFACLMAISTAYPEPPLVVKRRYRSGNEAARQDHPLQKLIDLPTPNGELSTEEILFWTAWAKAADGNAYWLKVRSGDARAGNVVQLWPVSPTLMEPVTRENSGDWISFYRYRVAPNRVVEVPVENVIHFRQGVDDRDMRKGLSSIKALARQIATDDEADRFVAALLQNYAVPGLVVVPGQGVNLSEEDANRLTARLRQKFGNDNRGNIAVMSKESTVQQFGFSPKDLDMSILHRIPEERISAAMGVPAIVAGLGAGLDRATYANFKEAREMFTEQRLIPLWRADAAKLTTSLLPDFDSTRGLVVQFDLTGVRSLQDDEDSKYARLQQAVGKPWMTRNEARTDAGLDPVDGWDDEDIGPSEPQPAQLQPPDDPNADDMIPADQTSGKRLDLDRWRRKAIKAVKDGRPAMVKFESAHIPAALAGAICGALESAKNADDVQRIFSDRWLGYP